MFYKESQGSQVILRDGARYTVAHTSYYVDDERVEPRKTCWSSRRAYLQTPPYSVRI